MIDASDDDEGQNVLENRPERLGLGARAHQTSEKTTLMAKKVKKKLLANVDEEEDSDHAARSESKDEDEVSLCMSPSVHCLFFSRVAAAGRNAKQRRFRSNFDPMC